MPRFLPDLTNFSPCAGLVSIQSGQDSTLEDMFLKCIQIEKQISIEELTTKLRSLQIQKKEIDDFLDLEASEQKEQQKKTVQSSIRELNKQIAEAKQLQPVALFPFADCKDKELFKRPVGKELLSNLEDSWKADCDKPTTKSSLLSADIIHTTLKECEEYATLKSSQIWEYLLTVFKPSSSDYTQLIALLSGLVTPVTSVTLLPKLLDSQYLTVREALAGFIVSFLHTKNMRPIGHKIGAYVYSTTLFR